MTSAISLWTAVSKSYVWHYGGCHLAFVMPEVALLGLEDGASEATQCYASTYLYQLLYSKWYHQSQNEHHAALTKT